MKFFLRTRFGDSKEFATATGDMKTQGMCQGIGVAPVGWTVHSIAIIQAHKQKGHGIHLQCLVSKKTIHLAEMLFIDNTGLEHFDLTKRETVRESHIKKASLIGGAYSLQLGGHLSHPNVSTT
jgi:hypothetical protein